jgi:hypothetical protein
MLEGVDSVVVPKRLNGGGGGKSLNGIGASVGRSGVIGVFALVPSVGLRVWGPKCVSMIRFATTDTGTFAPSADCSSFPQRDVSLGVKLSVTHLRFVCFVFW